MNSKPAVGLRIRGNTEALYMLTTTPKQRFEFIFTDLVVGNVKHFTSIFEIYKMYQSTLMYRELKLRSAILTEGQLNILPQEQLYNRLNGIYNLSSDQGNIGTFIVTNVRLVWFADSNASFNISMPYIQMAVVSIWIEGFPFGFLNKIILDSNTGVKVRPRISNSDGKYWWQLCVRISYRSNRTLTRCLQRNLFITCNL